METVLDNTEIKTKRQAEERQKEKGKKKPTGSQASYTKARAHLGPARRETRSLRSVCSGAAAAPDSAPEHLCKITGI